MSNFHEEDSVMRPKKKFDDIIEEINEELDKVHRGRKEGHCYIDDREFQQFKKGWFYHHWSHRFRRLGNVGVIAIPNTSLSEWIYWLYEWSQAFVDDYNKFKDLVFEAIKLHEEHLSILDAQIKDLQIRVEEIERQLVLIWDEIRKLIQEVNNLKQVIENISNEVNNLKQEVNNLKANNEKLDKIIQNLINSGAWNSDTNDFNPNRNIATGNINFFGGSTDGGSFIRTNNGQTENDVTAGI